MKVRRAMDAPRENPILVFLALFLLASFIAQQYQISKYCDLKTAILKEARVKRAFEKRKPEEKQLTKKERKKIKKKKSELDINDYDDDVLTEIIKETDLVVVGWTGQKPSFTDAAISVLKSPYTITAAVYS